MITMDDFQSDQQGRRFTDVINDPRINFQLVVDFFNDQDRVRRMIDSELHHDRPPLAGVVKEFEAIQEIDSFFSGQDSHTTTRFRQAIGVLIRMHMEQQGWNKTGRKGSLGTRAKTPPRTTTPGAYHNTSGLSKWFTRCEKYERGSTP
jgi:hypothetical protein